MKDSLEMNVLMEMNPGNDIEMNAKNELEMNRRNEPRIKRRNEREMILQKQTLKKS